MTNKLLVRKGAAANISPAVSKWVNYDKSHSSYDIALPSDQLANMMHELMLRVQAGLQPRVTWQLTDNQFQHIITMRWQSPIVQLQLNAHLSLFGIWLQLDSGCNFADNLATWWAERETRYDPNGWSAQYGDLRVYRSERHGNGFVADLRFDDPVFDSIPRYRSCHDQQRPKESDLPELGDDIIAVTQGWLYVAGIASNPARR